MMFILTINGISDIDADYASHPDDLDYCCICNHLCWTVSVCYGSPHAREGRVELARVKLTELQDCDNAIAEVRQRLSVAMPYIARGKPDLLVDLT
jgi:hypothetical protein